MTEPRVVNVTFLFADVEGSTRLVKHLRDEYAAVLAEHRTLLRAAFSRHGGTEVDTQGDSFFYVFSRARDAALAAADAQRALQAHAWPEDAAVRVRMGLHTGEPVVSEAGYHGLGVHRAARIMASGHGGQILASQATAAMLADDDLPGVESRDLGEFRLKDLDRPERVYQLDVEGLPTAFPPLRTGEDEPPEIPATARKPLSRRPLAIGVIAGILAAAVAVPIFALGRGSDGSTSGLQRVQDNAVGIVNVKSREIVDEAPGIASPQRVAAGADAIWVTSGAGTVLRLDPKSHDVTDTIEVGNGPVGIAVGAGSVWVANSSDGTVMRIDPAAHRVVDTITVGNTPTAVTFGAGYVWVTNSDDRSVSKIDPATGDVLQESPIDAAPRWAVVGDGALWVTDSASNAVVRIDVRAVEVTDRITVGSGPTALAYGNGSVWVTNSLAGTASRIDTKRAVVIDTIRVGASPSGVAVAPDGVWMSDEVAGTLVHLNPASGKQETTRLGGRPAALTLADGELWVTVLATGAAHRGGTLRMLTGFHTLDPALCCIPPELPLVAVLYDGLIGFKRVGGTDGNTLVPDLAKDLPSLTDSGKTYTFRLRNGIKFSDGHPLKASAFRSSLERALKALPGNRKLYEAINGAAACTNQRCDLSKGIVTDDDAGIVTIKLRAPDPEFLSKLSLPFAAIVRVRTGAPGGTPVLGTGPYRVADYAPPRARLVRNSYFKVWSKAAQPEATPDEITLNWAGTSDAALTAVELGRADYVSDVPLDRLQEARTRYAVQFHATPGLLLTYLVLDATRPPFDDERVRRAVALAYDRGRVVAAYGGATVAAATCQLLPANFPAYRPYCPFTLNATKGGAWTAPDLAAARKLVAASGTKGMHVNVLGMRGKDFHTFAVITNALEETLRQLGYRTSVNRFENVDTFFAALREAAPRVEASFSVMFGLYPSPADFLTGLLSCSLSLSPRYSCSPAIDRKFRETLALQARDPKKANAAWARLERELVDQAVIVPLVNPQWTDFVSKRLGNYQRHPFFGMLIGQVWVR